MNRKPATAIIDITDASNTAIYQQVTSFRALVNNYHTDADFRRRVEADPVAAFREQGIELPDNIDIQVTANTDDTFYIVLPTDPNRDLGDETLTTIAGGDTTGTARSVSTMSTA